MLNIFRHLIQGCSVRSTQLRTFSVKPSLDIENPSAASSDEPEWNMENPYERERKQCILCKHNIDVDYKNVRLLTQFVSPYTGRTYDRHITGLCTTQQTRVIQAIRLARMGGLMPHMHKNVKYVKDPKLFDPFKPTRPNPY